MNAAAAIKRNFKRHRTCTGRTPYVHRRIAACVTALTLTACSMPQVEDVEIGLRNPTTPLGGTSRFDVSRFAGEWRTLQCLGTCDSTVQYVEATDGVLLRRADDDKTPFLVPSPGVLREMGGAETLVVMWVDEGFRTAVVGDAEGRWAAVIDRGAGSADRLAAAREILDFNGWDVSQLRDTE